MAKEMTPQDRRAFRVFAGVLAISTVVTVIIGMPQMTLTLAVLSALDLVGAGWIYLMTVPTLK
ncbi:hypothetical protein [Streptomyces eurythermus]